MKKVLLVATVQSHICQFHRPLVEMLHENGVIVHVAARDNLEEKNGLKLDFVEQVYNIPFARSPINKTNIIAYQQLKKIIEEGNYDVVHCNTPVGGILTRLAAGKVRKNGTKVYYTAHGFHFYKGAPILNWLLYYPIEKIFARKTDKLITIVSEDYQIASKDFSCPVHRIHGVGVEEKKFFPLDVEEKNLLRKKLGFSPKQKIILCVGELLSNKNQQMIIRAMPKIIEYDPNIILLLAGNGPRKEELETLIESLSLQKNIKMLGYVTNIHEYHKISDLLVSCSIREGLGLNAIESLMVGNPVVLTDNRGHRELIDEGHNGYLIPINDVEQMTEKIIETLSSHTEYKKMSDNAKEFSAQYGVKLVKKELQEIYDLPGKVM